MSSAAIAAICAATVAQTRIVSWLLVIDASRCSGYTTYPMRHPAKPYAFESEYIEIVCPSAPGADPAEKWAADPYVKYSYTSSAM